MKKILALAIVALVVPSVALAAKPPSPPGQSNSNSHSKAPQVLYVLKGVITSITNAPTAVPAGTLNTSAGGATTVPVASYSCDSGAVTIKVKRVNHKRVFKALTANNDPLTLTFCLDAKTKVIVKGHGRVALANLATVVPTSANGYHGMVKVRDVKKFDLATDLQGFLTTAAKQVIVKKALPTG